jgi:hypothetical protein
MNEVTIPINVTGLGAIKAELKALKGEIANATDPADILRLSQAAGVLKDQIQDANEAVNVFASGSKFQQASMGFAGIGDSIRSMDFEEAAQKAQVFATSIANIKPDDIQKAMSGLVSTIGSVGRAFVSLGQTLLANPIYLIAAVIAAVIAIVVVLMDKLGYLDIIMEGVGTAFDAALEAMNAFIDSMGLAVTESEQFKAVQETTTQAMTAYETAGAGAIQVTNEVGNAFEMAANGVITKKEALDIYNEKLGDTFGAATTLAQAEANYVAKTEAYIQATMLRAKAEVFAKKAAEEQAKALTAGLKDQTTSGDKATSWMMRNKAATVALGVVTGGTFLAIAAGATMVMSSEESLADKQKKRVKEKKKEANATANIYEEEAAKAMETALKLEDANKITIDGDKKKTKSNKSETDKRIKEAEAEAKRLNDLAIKENENRIKREDAQFDLMNEMTLNAKQKEEMALNQAYDKKFEIANGNEELEKVLLDKQKADLQAIRDKYLKIEEDKVKAAEAIKAKKILDQQTLLAELTMTDEQKKIAAIEAQYVKEQELANGHAETLLALKVKHDKDIENANTMAANAAVEKDRQVRDAKLGFAKDTVDGLTNLGGLLIKDQAKLAKFNKASALVQIGIDTAKAISALVAAANTNPLNGVTAGTAGIAQFASGIIQIATNIAKAKQLLTSPSTPVTSGGGGGGGDTGGGSNTATMIPQAAQLFGSSNNANTMNAGGPTSSGGGNMMVTAVVSETQITNVQKKINMINKNSEL